MFLLQLDDLSDSKELENSTDFRSFESFCRRIHQELAEKTPKDFNSYDEFKIKFRIKDFQTIAIEDLSNIENFDLLQSLALSQIYMDSSLDFIAERELLKALKEFNSDDCGINYSRMLRANNEYFEDDSWRLVEQIKSFKFIPGHFFNPKAKKLRKAVEKIMEDQSQRREKVTEYFNIPASEPMPLQLFTKVIEKISGRIHREDIPHVANYYSFLAPGKRPPYYKGVIPVLKAKPSIHPYGYTIQAERCSHCGRPASLDIASPTSPSMKSPSDYSSYRKDYVQYVESNKITINYSERVWEANILIDSWHRRFCQL